MLYLITEVTLLVVTISSLFLHPPLNICEYYNCHFKWPVKATHVTNYPAKQM